MFINYCTTIKAALIIYGLETIKAIQYNNIEYRSIVYKKQI